MKLNAKCLAYIINVVKTAKTLKIQNVIIEPGKVRAMDDNQSVVIFQDEDVPTFEFGSIGLNRLEVFISRFDIIRSTDSFSIDVSTAGEDNSIGYDKFDLTNRSAKQPMYARSINMTGTNIEIDYRCTNPAVLKAPKTRSHDNKFKISLTENAFTMIQKGKLAMQSELVNFTGNTKGVFLSVTDINGDTLKYKFADEVVNILNDDPPKFSFSYPIEVLVSIFKDNPNTLFYITNKGFLTSTINDLTVYVAPKT